MLNRSVGWCTVSTAAAVSNLLVDAGATAASARRANREVPVAASSTWADTEGPSPAADSGPASAADTPPGVGSGASWPVGMAFGAAVDSAEPTSAAGGRAAGTAIG